MKRKICNLNAIVENINLNEADEKLGLDMDKLLDNSKDLAKSAGEKSWKITKTIAKALEKAIATYAADKAGDLIDELLLGQFKDAMIDIYKKDKLDSMDEDAAQAEYDDLSKDSKFKMGIDKSEMSNRKDENTSSEIDPSTEKIKALWYDKDKEQNVGKILSDLVADIQKSAQSTEQEQKDLAKKLKEMKVDATDEDLMNFGPILAKSIADGNDAATITKNLKKLKGEVKESYEFKLRCIRKEGLLNESTFILTEDIKQKALLESIVNTNEFRDIIAESMVKEGLITEGFWSGVLKVAAGATAAGVMYKLMPAKWQDKVKDFGSKTIKFLTNKTLSGIVSLGGLGLSVLTGGWGATLALKAIYAVERHGKVLANAFERQYTRFANSKGIITQMDFKIKDQKDSNYSMRFYSKDKVWRVLNVNDQLKHPGKDYAKAIIDGKEGKKYREQLAKIWDPLFDKAKGGKIDFAALFEQAKNVKIPEKSIKAFQDFAEQYEDIKKNCIESPKIDTRTQELKKDKLDK